MGNGKSSTTNKRNQKAAVKSYDPLQPSTHSTKQAASGTTTTAVRIPGASAQQFNLMNQTVLQSAGV